MEHRRRCSRAGLAVMVALLLAGGTHGQSGLDPHAPRLTNWRAVQEQTSAQKVRLHRASSDAHMFQSWTNPLLRSMGIELTGVEPHKRLLPLRQGDIFVIIGAGLTLFLAAGAGIGGGGVLLPLYLFAGGFQTRHAVALCNVTVAGGAVANFLCNIQRRQAVSGRPLIDWDLVLIMEPTTILGAVLGGYLNAVIPIWITTILLALLLLYITVKLIYRACNTYIAETANTLPNSRLERLHTGDGLSELFIAYQPDLASDTGTDTPCNEKETLLHVQQAEAALQALRLQEQQALPPVTLAALLLMAAWVVASDSLKLQLRCGSVYYWLAVLSLVPCALVVLLVARQRLLHKAHVKAELGMQRHRGELKWDERTTLLYPALCSFAGLIAGLFGVGGGIIKGPLLLELGVLPEVAAATSATMILLTAGSASVVHISFGFVMPDYGALLIVLGFLATLTGQLVTYRLIRKLQRRSLITFLMAGMLATSEALMCVRIYVEMKRLVEYPNELYNFGNICRE